jgi:(p)ppGpp synthase/HD superfamily hydrolase
VSAVLRGNPLDILSATEDWQAIDKLAFRLAVINKADCFKLLTICHVHYNARMSA